MHVAQSSDEVSVIFAVIFYSKCSFSNQNYSLQHPLTRGTCSANPHQWLSNIWQGDLATQEGKGRLWSELRRFRSCSALVQTGITGSIPLLWRGWDRRYLCCVSGISRSSLRALLAPGTCKKQFQPGTIQNSELMLGKDSVLVFQDACKAEFVNADDGNNAFGRVLAHWD